MNSDDRWTKSASRNGLLNPENDIIPGTTLIITKIMIGEDFELMLAIETERVVELLAAWGQVFPGLRLTVIGRLVEMGAGETLTGGWDHFAVGCHEGTSGLQKML